MNVLISMGFCHKIDTTFAHQNLLTNKHLYNPLYLRCMAIFLSLTRYLKMVWRISGGTYDDIVDGRKERKKKRFILLWHILYLHRLNIQAQFIYESNLSECWEIINNPRKQRSHSTKNIIHSYVTSNGLKT